MRYIVFVGALRLEATELNIINYAGGAEVLIVGDSQDNVIALSTWLLAQSTRSSGEIQQVIENTRAKVNRLNDGSDVHPGRRQGGNKSRPHQQAMLAVYLENGIARLEGIVEVVEVPESH